VAVLLDGAASLARKDRSKLLSLARELLALESYPDFRGGVSGLNYDGSPLQLCLSSSPERVSCRLLVDPACDQSDPLARYQNSLVAVSRALSANESTTSLSAVFERTLALNLPNQGEPFSYPDGVLWVAVGLDSPGCALYVDARRGGAEIAHSRLVNWLKETCGSTEDVLTLASALGGKARLMCLGIEGVSSRLSRAKVYWRLDKPRLLSDVGLDRFRNPLFIRFLALCLGNRTIRLDGIVLNAGVAVATGQLSDVKLDVCGCLHCLNYAPEEAVRVSDAISDQFGLCRLPVQEALSYGEVAFFGLGIDGAGRARFNVYLKPRSALDSDLSRAALTASR